MTVPRNLSKRPDGMVQVPLRRTEQPGNARKIESLLIFCVFAVIFGAVGYQVVCAQHVIVFEALDRLTRAMYVWHNDPPKLAAVGFVFPPLTTLALLPFTAVKSLGSSLIALPACSAIFGGLTMVMLNRILERCELGRVRYAALALIAANPLLVFYAATGVGELVGVFLVGAAMAALIGWYTTVDTRYLISAGLAFSLACVADYGLILWWLIGAALIGVTLIRHHANRSEVEASLVTYMSPAVYVIALWTMFSALIAGDPFAWLTGGGHTTAVNAAVSTPIPADLAAVASGMLRLLAAGAPLAFVVGPGLVICAVAQRNELAAWLAAFLAAAILTPGADALIHNDLTQLTLRETMPILLVSLIGAAWLYRSLEKARPAVAVVLAAALLVSVPVTFKGLDRYPYQNMEQAFARALRTSADQEGSRSRGGLDVGVLSERAMAGYLLAHNAGPGSVLTDNAQTFGVIALTGSPQMFSDRVDAGDDAWRNQARRPSRRVRYLLIAKNAQSDLLRGIYPNAATGRDARFTLAYDTPRYALVTIPGGLDGAPAGENRPSPQPAGAPLQTDPR